jgi:hypothetical protein
MAEKYITLGDGQDFRLIAKKMTDAGWNMNHATARNVLMAAMATLVKNIGNRVGKPLSEEELFSILKNQNTYDSLQEVLTEAYLELKEESANIP